MTEKEKSALKEAFGFEEPDRKDAFIQEFVKLERHNNKKTLFPFVIKFVAAAAVMTAVIGNAVLMPKDIKNLENDNIIAEINDETTTVKKDETTTVKKTDKAETATTHITTTKVKKTSLTTVISTNTSKTSVSDATTVLTTVKDTTVATTDSQNLNTTTTVRSEAEHESTRVNEQQEKTDSPSGIHHRDLTVSVDKSYPHREKTITEDQLLNIGSNSPVTSNDPSSDESFQPKDSSKSGINIDISEMYNNSCAVVLANLDEIVYTSIGGKAFTAENITVTQVYKGDIQENDRITVFFKGGFIPAEEYSELYGFPPMPNQDEYSVKVAGESGGDQKEGKSYIFFLKGSGETLPNGAYEPINMGNLSVFELQQNLCRSVGDGNLMFTISQIESGF